MTTFFVPITLCQHINFFLNLTADVKYPFNLRLSLHQLSNPNESFFTNQVVPPHHVVLAANSAIMCFQTIILSGCLIFYKTIVSKTIVYELCFLQ